MEYAKFMKTFRLEYPEEVVYLGCWIEPDGEEATLNFAVYPAGEILIKLGMTGKIDHMHENFDDLNEKKARQVFEFGLAPIIDQLKADKSDNG